MVVEQDTADSADGTVAPPDRVTILQGKPALSRLRFATCPLLDA
jgi:hypothetical protein